MAIPASLKDEATFSGDLRQKASDFIQVLSDGIEIEIEEEKISLTISIPSLSQEMQVDMKPIKCKWFDEQLEPELLEFLLFLWPHRIRIF